MNAHDIYSKLSDEVADDGGDRSSFSLAQLLMNAAGRLLKELGPDKVEGVVAAARLAYQRFVAPLDIPGIPNFVEPAVDQAVEEALAKGIRYLADRLQQAAG